MHLAHGLWDRALDSEVPALPTMLLHSDPHPFRSCQPLLLPDKQPDIQRLGSVAAMRRETKCKIKSDSMRNSMQMLTLFPPATNIHLVFSYRSPQSWIKYFKWLKPSSFLFFPLWCNLKLSISHIASHRAKHKPSATAGILC